MKRLEADRPAALLSVRVQPSLDRALTKRAKQEAALPPILVPQRDGPGLLLHHDASSAEPEIAAHSRRDPGRYRTSKCSVLSIAVWV